MAGRIRLTLKATLVCKRPQLKPSGTVESWNIWKRDWGWDPETGRQIRENSVIKHKEEEFQGKNGQICQKLQKLSRI